MKIAFDVGGTFTDVVIVLDDGSLVTYKISSLLDHLGEDIAACIDRTKASAGDEEVTGFVHATTVASNAVLESEGASVGLLTTRGFRDEMEIRRFIRPISNGYFWERRPPLIPRRRRLEIGERINADGEVVTPLSEADVLRAVERLREHRVDAVAIAFLNSYVNARHEQRAAELVREHLPGIPVAVSSDVSPAIGEYERTSTTALTAYLAPRVHRYLDGIETATRRYHPSLFMMQANGGIIPSAHARRFPTRIIESGPAAGVLGACAVAKRLGIQHAVSFDMGGTTVKAMLIENGHGREKAQMEVGGGGLVPGAGYALRASAFDLVEIGAGGGSIAWIDAGGALRVGPKSAGASPGPVCYGRSGTQPTVTDANVVLGYMSPVALAGGTVPIDKDAAVRAFEATLCPPLGLSAVKAAAGVHHVANVTMMRALRAVTTERGQDPRECTLIAFGGAGPIHAAHLADDLEMSRVVIPMFPGLFSALGLLLADLRFDYLQSIPQNYSEVDPSALVETYGALERQAKDELGAVGVDASQAASQRFADMHYQGQTTHLSVPLYGTAGSPDLQRLARDFHAEHTQVYGYAQPDESLVFLNARLRITASAGNLDLQHTASAFLERRNGTGGDSIREVHFAGHNGPLRTRILTRGALAGETVEGPVILEEFDTTVVVPPGWRAQLDAYANVILSRDREAR